MSDARQARSEAKVAAAEAKARAKAMRPWYRKKRFIIPLILVVLIVLIAVGGGGEEDDDNGSNGANGGSSQTETYTKGQTAHSGDFDITLHTVEDPYTPSSEFERPDEGNRYVAVEVEVRNTSDERRPLSTLLGAEVIDSLNRPYDIALAGLDRPQLDGDVPAGESRRGWMTFEVPADATGLKLRLKGNLTAQGSLFIL